MTFHAAKGLEFENVLIPFLSESGFPDHEALEEYLSENDAMSNELKLLYVGITRSKYGLFLSYSGNISALLSDNFSKFAFDHIEG